VSDRWRENSNGNWVLIEDGELEATVYKTDLGWGSVWNGALDGKSRRHKGKHASAEEAIAATEAAIAEGQKSMKWWPPDDQWQQRKAGGYYRKHNGRLISVKKAKTGSWFATNGDASMGRHGSTTWFPSPEEARAAVDPVANGGGEWHWVSWSDVA
jgi:hypothetical protein